MLNLTLFVDSQQLTVFRFNKLVLNIAAFSMRRISIFALVSNLKK